MSSKPTKFLPFLAAVVAVLAATTGLFKSHEPVVLSDESVSVDGAAFPSSIKISGVHQVLLGGGALGRDGHLAVYSDPKNVRYIASRRPGIPMTGGTIAAAGFYGSRLAKTLLFRFGRGASASVASDAMMGGAKRLAGRIGAERAEAYANFTAGVLDGDLEEGQDVFVECNGETLWASREEGKNAATIERRGLCGSVLMAYLGKEPVSEKIRDAVQKGVDELLAK